MTADAGTLHIRDVPHGDRPQAKPSGVLRLVHSAKQQLRPAGGVGAKQTEPPQAGAGAAAANLAANFVQWVTADPRHLLFALGCAALLGAALSSPMEER